MQEKPTSTVIAAREHAQGAELYSVSGWPPEPLARFMAREQGRLGVSGFGPPHLNLRSVFSHPDPAALAEQLGDILADQPPLALRLRGWRKLPSMIFLELERSPELMALHERLLDLAPAGPFDGAEFLPHLTFALGILPWAEQELWEQVQTLEASLHEWHLSQLTLTREAGGPLKRNRLTA